MSHTRPLPLLALTAGALLVSVLAPRPAAACGGFFCSAIQLVPVEQNAERILFEINDDDTITTIVEIRYVGDPDEFSWVVPVPADEVDLAVTPIETLVMLDDATAPTIIPPPTKCTQAPGPPGAMMARAGEDDDDWAEDGVDVTELEQVGPYDSRLVSSDNADDLINWLNDNDYLITPEMEPYVADYVASGMNFVAVKLVPDAAVDEISPLAMTYEGTEPSIPLMLTAVAAEPEMGILVFIAGSEPYESSNYTPTLVPTDQVSMNPRTGQNNYYPLVSWLADEAGGQTVFTEYVDDVSAPVNQAENNWGWSDDYTEALDWLDGLRQRQDTITRLYSRASSWEMDADPRFAPGGAGYVSNVHDLSDRPEVELCRDAPSSRRVPCGDNYCGVGALCATTEADVEGCVCPEGDVARVISEPDLVAGQLVQTVVCQDESHDMMASVAELDLVGSFDDPCAMAACGENGTCVDVGGFGTCRCDEGYAGVALFDGTLTCAAVRKTYEPGALLWTSGCGGCQGNTAAGSAGLAALLLPLLALARRRRLSL